MRSNLEPGDKTDEPVEDSCLMLDFIKLAAATGATTKASSNQIDQMQTNSADACTIGTEDQQGQKHLEELLNQTLLVPPAKTTESDLNYDSSTPQGSINTYEQRQLKQSAGITFRRQWNRHPPLDPVRVHRLSSGSVFQGVKSKLLLQDLECGQSGGDLVQVQVAQLAGHGSWDSSHYSEWNMDSSTREKPFCKFSSWAGRNSGLLAGVLLDDAYEDATKTDGGYADGQLLREIRQA